MTVTEDALKHSNDNSLIPAKISTSFSPFMTDYPNDPTKLPMITATLINALRDFLTKHCLITTT